MGIKIGPNLLSALRSGIAKGAINAAWDAIGEVIKAWATVLIGLSALCWTSCGSTKQISRETETRANTNSWTSQARSESTNVTNERDSVVIAERDTLKRPSLL